MAEIALVTAMLPASAASPPDGNGDQNQHPGPSEADAYSASFEGAWTEKVIVEDVDTGAFTCTLAVVSSQVCDSREDAPALGGFALYGVTDPTAPALLSTHHAGRTR